MAYTAVESRPLAPGLGAKPAADAQTVCSTCNHPRSLHRNGASSCRAYACTGGPSQVCGRCGGANLTAAPCEDCEGSGTVSLPCQGYTAEEPASLAS
jgi:hypothetical protein